MAGKRDYRWRLKRDAGERDQPWQTGFPLANGRTSAGESGQPRASHRRAPRQAPVRHTPRPPAEETPPSPCARHTPKPRRTAHPAPPARETPHDPRARDTRPPADKTPHKPARDEIDRSGAVHDPAPLARPPARRAAGVVATAEGRRGGARRRRRAWALPECSFGRCPDPLVLVGRKNFQQTFRRCRGGLPRRQDLCHHLPDAPMLVPTRRNDGRLRGGVPDVEKSAECPDSRPVPLWAALAPLENGGSARAPEYVEQVPVDGLACQQLQAPAHENCITAPLGGGHDPATG